MTSEDIFSRPMERREFLRVAGLSVPVISAAVTIVGCSGDQPAGGGAAAKWSTLKELSAEEGADFIGTPIYIAEELGYFKEEGLTVQTEYPGSTPRTVQLLLVGRGNVALPDPAATIAAKARGHDLKALWTYGRSSFFGFAVAPGSPIQQWDTASIRGKKIGISELAGGEVPLLRGAFAALGLKENEDVEITAVGGGSAEAAEAVESGKIDVIAGSYPDFFGLQARGVKLRFVTPASIESFPRNSVTVKAADLESHREELTGYLRALSKGMVFLNANPVAAAKIAKKYAPENLGDLDIETLSEVLLKGLLVRGLTDYFKQGSPVYQKVGSQDPKAWDTYMTFLVEGGVESEGVTLDKPVSVREIVDNSLIDPANDFDYAAIEKQAKDYRAT